MGDGLEQYEGDAIGFFSEVLKSEPYDKQVEILDAVSQRRRVSVVGCNGSGKDWTAGRIVLWWMHTRSPSKAVVTGPTTRQVNDIVWSELRRAHQDAGGALDGRLFRRSRYEVDGHGFAIGFATNSPYNLQGFHSPNLLAVVTEAHAVGDDDMDAVLRLNPALLLLTGNPFTVSGTFFDSHHGQRHRYGTVRITAFETPNLVKGQVAVPGLITPEDVEERRQDWGEDSDSYRGSVLAEFPERLDNTFVSAKDARAAVERSLRPCPPVVVACDVARFGSSKTVAVHRAGQVARIVHRTQGRDTMQTANFLKRYVEDNRVDFLLVDEPGVGAGVIDRLREMGVPGARLFAFNGGGKADAPDKFANRSTECWTRMALAYERGDIDTDNDDALIAQVVSRKYLYTSDGRTRIEGKEKLRHSPDEADALAMTYADAQDREDASYHVHADCRTGLAEGEFYEA